MSEVRVLFKSIKWGDALFFHGPLRILLGRMPLRSSNSNLKMLPKESGKEWVERIRVWYKDMWKREKENDDRRRRELKTVTQSIGDYFRRVKRLGVSWVPMAAELGLTPVDVAVIKTDSGDIHEQIERVIYQWRYYMVMDGFSMNITVDALIDFLEESLVFYDLLDYLNKTAFKTIGKTWEPKYEVPPRRQSVDAVVDLAAVGAKYRARSMGSVDSNHSTDSDLEDLEELEEP